MASASINNLMVLFLLLEQNVIIIDFRGRFMASASINNLMVLFLLLEQNVIIIDFRGRWRDEFDFSIFMFKCCYYW